MGHHWYDEYELLDFAEKTNIGLNLSAGESIGITSLLLPAFATDKSATGNPVAGRRSLARHWMH